MMISCKQATELVSKSLDTHLSWRERLALRSHLLMCKLCRRYNQQLQYIIRIIRQGKPEDWLPQLRLSEEAKQRIMRHMRNDG